MNKIHVVEFTSGTTAKTITGLFQWNFGQILQIKGLDLPSAVEVHFALRRSGEAIRRIGVTKDGVTEVEIPDVLFKTMMTSDYDIYAYVYVSDEEYGSTTHEIVMKVKSRPMPDDVSDNFEKIMEAVKAIADGKVDKNQGIANNGKLLGVVNGYVVLVDAPSGTTDAVRYVEQELTEEQKEQARANIGAANVTYDTETKTLNICLGGGTTNGLIEQIEDYVIENEIEKIVIDGVEVNLSRYAKKEETDRLSEEIDDLKENGTGETITAECIDYDVTVKTISHRGYNTEAPENTIPAYVLARQKGYKYAECDVSFTSDGVAVLLHDSTIDRTSDGTGSISALTYEEVSQYDFGSWFSSDFTGTKIPTFKEFIVLCRNIGLYPYIELKNNGGYTQETVNGLVEIVKATGMLKKVTWISFSSTFLGYVKNADSTARLGFLCDTVSDESTATAINSIQNLQNEENEVFADSSMHYLSDEKIQQFIDANIPLEVYYIATDETKISEKVLNANEYISGFTLDKGIAGKILHENYMNYIPSEPDTPDKPEVTLSSISATYTGGNVTVGTSVNDLTGITVKATYSDGSTANVLEYALSGTITEGENTVTVTYQGKTTTFMVTGVAESGGEEPDIPDEPTTGSLIRNWDFTSSLIDSIGNNEARKSSDGVVQNENGITISGQYQQLGMYDVVGANKRIEIDVHSMSADFTGRHGRFLMFDSNGHTSMHSNGFIYRSTGSWDFYNDSWKGTTVEVNANAFTGKTIVIEIGAECIPKVYCDNVLIAESPTAIDSTITGLFIGDSANAYSTVTISGVRVYNIS